MKRHFLTCCLSAALVAAVLVPTASGAELSGERVFYSSESGGIFVVPEGVRDLTILARGASGAQVRKTGESGHGAVVTGSFAVVPGEELQIFVADDEQNGYGAGGAHGKVAGSAHDGAAGGGASAVVAPSPPAPMVIAGGGGGAGGDNNASGGAGGDGGSPFGNPGQPGQYTDGSGEYINENIEPGCGGCESGGTGGNGDSDHNFTDAGGGGGAGGGGARGGAGGQHGYTFSSHDTEEGGAGGGGGSSYIRSGAFGPAYNVDSGCVSNGQQSAACEGLVVLSWGAPPAGIATLFGDGQGVPLTAAFEPIEVRVTDANGIAVTGVPVTFAVPGTGPSGVLPGGLPTVVVETDATGVAALWGVASQAPVGAWKMTASIPGGASTQISLLNQAIPTEVALTSTPDPSTVAEPLEISAEVTGTVGDRTLPPTGAVQFEFDEVPVGSPVALDPATETAQLPAGTIPPPDAGPHTIAAHYLGDAAHAAEAAGRFQLVDYEPTALSVEGLPDPVSDGSPVDIRATIRTQTAGPLPTGTVSFESDGQPLGTAPVEGGVSATLHLASLPLGTHEIGAIYSGDKHFAAGNGLELEVVDDAAVAAVLGSSVNPSTFGTPTRVEAEIRRAEPGPVPAGTVDFTVDGDTVCAEVQTAAAVAGCDLPAELAAGEHVVRAAFEPALGSGDAPASGALMQLVVPSLTDDALATTPSTAIFDKPFALGSTVLRSDGVPATGSVQFKLDRFPAAPPVALASGHAALADACAGTAPGGDCPLGVGVHTVVSEFLPADGNLRVSRMTALIHVEPEPTSTGARPPDGASSGVPTSFLATVGAPSGAAEGAVQFQLDGKVIGAPVALVEGSAASPPTRPLEPGRHVVVAHYLGAERFEPSESVRDFDAGTSVGSPKLRLLGREARVQPDGTLRIRAACEGSRGTACDSTVYLRLPVGDDRGAQTLLARAHVHLVAGSTGAPQLALRPSGRGMLSKQRTLEARVRFSGDDVDSRLRLRSTQAPLLAPESVHRRYRSFVVRLSCQPSAGSSMPGCEGEVELSADGLRVGAVGVAANRAGPLTARIRLPRRYRSGADAEVLVRVRSRVEVGEERVTTGSFAVRPQVLGSRSPAT